MVAGFGDRQSQTSLGKDGATPCTCRQFLTGPQKKKKKHLHLYGQFRVSSLPHVFIYGLIKPMTFLRFFRSLLQTFRADTFPHGPKVDIFIEMQLE